MQCKLSVSMAALHLSGIASCDATGMIFGRIQPGTLGTTAYLD